MHRRFIAWTGCLLAVSLAGCVSTTPTPAPPPPQVWVTPEAAAPSLTVPPAPPAAAASPLPASPAELAVQLYGERLIRRIEIPAIGVDSPVVPVGWWADGSAVEWDSPGAAVGWALTSALPDDDGNVILYGHNNVYGSVFKNLDALEIGDVLRLETGQNIWEYRVSEVRILPLLAASADDLAAYRAYLQPAEESRLTVISCWPPASNTHRVVVIADPE